MTSPSVTAAATVAFPSVKSMLEGQQAVRKKWHAEFEANYKAFARNLAEAVRVKFFTALTGPEVVNHVPQQPLETFRDGYLKTPTKSSPMSLTVNLDLTRSKNIVELKTLVGPAAELAPFKQWFERFKPVEANVETHAVKAVAVELEDSGSISFAKVDRTDAPIEREFFQTEMARIGHEVKTLTLEHFERFAREAGNEKFRYSVEWYRKAEKMFSNPSDFRDNCLTLTAWIDDPTAISTESAPAAQNQSKWKCNQM